MVRRKSSNKEQDTVPQLLLTSIVNELFWKRSSFPHGKLLKQQKLLKGTVVAMITCTCTEYRYCIRNIACPFPTLPHLYSYTCSIKITGTTNVWRSIACTCVCAYANNPLVSIFSSEVECECLGIVQMICWLAMGGSFTCQWVWLVSDHSHSSDVGLQETRTCPVEACLTFDLAYFSRTCTLLADGYRLSSYLICHSWSVLNCRDHTVYIFIYMDALANTLFMCEKYTVCVVFV